jgi:hypothetical protein
MFLYFQLLFPKNFTFIIMKAKVKDLHKLLGTLSEKFGETISKRGLMLISENIGITSNYLYKNIYNPIEKLKDLDEIGLNEDILGKVCKPLGFNSYPHFVQMMDRKADDQLLTFVGSYYSYVRMNASSPVLLRSPVKIWEEQKQFFWELRGPKITYSGKIERSHGCMFILMKSKEGKTFYHVYKIGQSKSPVVLQGVFSGVSTAFDPIGGRAVLVKVNDEYKQLKNENLKLSDLRKPGTFASKELAFYFKAFHENNLSIRNSIAFNKTDLVG